MIEANQIIQRDTPTLDDCLNWYSQNTYYGNCHKHDSVYIRKGRKRAGLNIECTKCGCDITL